MLEPPAGELIY